jgi:flagellar motility protein MotE (MotC chaperone)
MTTGGTAAGIAGGARQAVSVLLVLGLAACKPALAPGAGPNDGVDPDAQITGQIAAQPDLEQLYAAERHGEVVLRATEILQDDPDDRELVAHARFFRAMSWLEQDRRMPQARALLELRELELEFGDCVWGQIAGAYVDTLLRMYQLQEALLELTLELREHEQQIRTLEQRLAEALTTLAGRDAKLTAVEHERDQLREQLDQAKAKATLNANRILELEAELAALKQVDMQREP